MAMDWKDALKGMLPDDYSPEPELQADPSQERQKGRLAVSVERKGRGGKTATIVSGFTVGDDTVADIAARLKKQLGTGGSARGGEILIQGDCRERVVAALRSMGLKC